MTTVQEDALLTMTVTNTTGVSTAGMTVYAYLSLGDSTPTSVGSTPGAAAGTDLVISVDFGLVTPGVYELEVVADPTATNPVVLIPSTATDDPEYIHVVARRTYS